MCEPRLTQIDWSFVFYKIEDDISSSCVTDIKVVAEGGAGPTGSDWFGRSIHVRQQTNEVASPHSAHYNVTSAGGPTLWSRRESAAQYAGNVVDLIIIKPGRWTNSTEGFIRDSVNLGLGEAAGVVAYESYREYDSISSGWAYLVSRVIGEPCLCSGIHGCGTESTYHSGPACGV